MSRRSSALTRLFVIMALAIQVMMPVLPVPPVR